MTPIDFGVTRSKSVGICVVQHFLFFNIVNNFHFPLFRTPVALENVDSIPSLKKPGKFDYKFSSNSRLSSPNYTLNFDYCAQVSEIKEYSLMALKNECSPFQRVN